MAHMIEGERMMYVGATPWHGIGKRLENPPTVEEGIRAAGLDWHVEMQRLQLPDGRAVDAYATVRSEDNKILGHRLGPQYTVLQNREAFRFFDPFLESGAATLHTAGCLFEGRVIWVLAHVANSKSEVVPGDRVDNFILLSNSHDGSLAVRVGFIPVRIVCANTLGMALNTNNIANKLIRVRHTKSIHENLANIREVMDLAAQQFSATMDQYRLLANRHISQADVRRYVKIVLGIDEKPLDDVSTRSRNIMMDIERLIYRGTGNDLPGVENTLWAAFNGVTEYLSYGRGSDRENRLDSLWFGSSAEMNRRALEVALTMAS